MGFIDEAKIKGLLAKGKNRSDAAEIILKSKQLKGLSPEEAAVLLQCEDAKLVGEMFSAAKFIKNEIYGNRLVLFAPLYLTNTCVNNCLYCGFRRDNKELVRKRLNMDEVRREVEVLLDEGHKRLLVVAGEDPDNLKYCVSAIEKIYSVKKGNGAIRRANINIAPLSVSGFKELKKCGIGTYQLFQETYHLPTYKIMHPSGPKADYAYRLEVMDRAMQAGIDDVGIGILYGLYDHKFETLAMLFHCLHLEEKFGVGPHTISVPRIEPAFNAPMAGEVPCPVSDAEFKKIVAVLRMAVPYTGIILSTRESASFRDEVVDLGVSQISAGSRTNPGAYVESKGRVDAEQFSLADKRSQAEVVRDMLDKGHLPSFCTACYRLGRTGHDFMELAKPGDIKEFCLPNCLLTFKEYLLDYGDPLLREKGERVILDEIKKIRDEKIRLGTVAKLEKIEKGERDLYF